jgi:hypothetical protein
MTRKNENILGCVKQISYLTLVRSLWNYNLSHILFSSFYGTTAPNGPGFPHCQTASVV